VVDPQTYIHPTWVRWPSAFGVDGDNRILSIMSASLGWAKSQISFSTTMLGGRLGDPRFRFVRRTRLFHGAGIKFWMGPPFTWSEGLPIQSIEPLCCWPYGRIRVGDLCVPSHAGTDLERDIYVMSANSGEDISSPFERAPDPH